MLYGHVQGPCGHGSRKGGALLKTPWKVSRKGPQMATALPDRGEGDMPPGGRMSVMGPRDEKNRIAGESQEPVALGIKWMNRGMKNETGDLGHV